MSPSPADKLLRRVRKTGQVDSPNRNHKHLAGQAGARVASGLRARHAHCTTSSMCGPCRAFSSQALAPCGVKGHEK